MEHVAVTFDPTPIVAQCLGADSPMKSCRLEACDHGGSQSRVFDRRKKVAHLICVARDVKGGSVYLFLPGLYKFVIYKCVLFI